jgi:hypothetical protein
MTIISNYPKDSGVTKVDDALNRRFLKSPRFGKRFASGIILNHRRQHTFWKDIDEESMLEKKLNDPGSGIE